MVFDRHPNNKYHIGMNRLKELRLAKGLTGVELARLVGTTQPQIFRLENATRKLTKEWAERLAPHLDVTPQELLFKDPPPAASRLHLVKSFDPSDPDPVMDFEAEAHDGPDPDQPPTIPPNGVVEADTRFAMGPGGAAQGASFIYHRGDAPVQSVDAIKPDPWIFPPWFLRQLNARPGDLMIAEASGDSMRPTIEPGIPLVIDLRHTIPSPDGIYAIRDSWGLLQFKRLENSKLIGDTTIRVVSDNGGLVQVAKSAEDIQIVGKVVGGWKLF